MKSRTRWSALALLVAAQLSGCGASEPAVVVDPPPPVFAYLFTQAEGTGRIAVHRINPRNGALDTVPSSVVSLEGASLRRSAIDPRGRALYVWSHRDGGPSGLLGYTIDPKSGALTAIPGSPFRAFADQDDAEDYEWSPHGMLLDPEGRFLYVQSIDVIKAYTVTDDGSGLAEVPGDRFWLWSGRLSINAAGTLLLAVHEHAVRPAGCTVMCSGYERHYGYARTYAIDRGTGRLKEADGVNLGEDRRGIVEPSGRFVYAVDNDGAATTWRVHDDGTITEGATAAFLLGYWGGSMARHPSGRFVYRVAGGIHGYALDITSGALQPLPGSPFLQAEGLGRIVVAPSGSYLYAIETANGARAARVHAFVIDAQTGALSEVPGSPFSVDGAPSSIEVAAGRE